MQNACQFVEHYPVEHNEARLLRRTATEVGVGQRGISKDIMCGAKSCSEELLLVRSVAMLPVEQWLFNADGVADRVQAKSLGRMINRWAQPWPKIYRCGGYRTHLSPFGLSFALLCSLCRELQIQLNKQSAMNAYIIRFGNPSPDRRRVSFPLADRLNCSAAPIYTGKVVCSAFPPQLNENVHPFEQLTDDKPGQSLIENSH